MANNLTTTSTQADINSSADEFFNNFFQPNFNISPNLNEAVIGFFEKITENTESARVLASAVVYTSLAQRVNPMEFITKFKNMTSIEAINYVSMFLNLNRVGTSFLGVNNQPKPSKYIARTIRP